jgi:hypothetical protein
LKWITHKIIGNPLEVTNIELLGARKEIIIIALYRSPSGILHKIFIYLIHILEQLVQKNCYIITGGVLNINIQEGGVATNNY